MACPINLVNFLGRHSGNTGWTHSGDTYGDTASVKYVFFLKNCGCKCVITSNIFLLKVFYDVHMMLVYKY